MVMANRVLSKHLKLGPKLFISETRQDPPNRVCVCGGVLKLNLVKTQSQIEFL